MWWAEYRNLGLKIEKKRGGKLNLCIFVAFSWNEFYDFEKFFDDWFCADGVGGLWR